MAPGAQTSTQQKPGAAGARPERGLFKGELAVIRQAARGFAIAAGVSLLLAGGSELLRWHLLKERANAQQLHAAAQAGLQEAESEKEEIREFQPKFVQLRARGFIGEEHRLDWVEAIARSQRERKLLPVKYEIAGQKPFEADPALVTGGMQLYGSVMMLSLKLWHEMDLLQLLGDLKTRGVFVPLECELKHTGAAQDNPSPAGLDAQCRLVWLTLDAPKADAATGDPGQ